MKIGTWAVALSLTVAVLAPGKADAFGPGTHAAPWAPPAPIYRAMPPRPLPLAPPRHRMARPMPPHPAMFAQRHRMARPMPHPAMFAQARRMGPPPRFIAYAPTDRRVRG